MSKPWPWQASINATAAGPDSAPVEPAWDGDGLPRCSEECRHHDGKRCELLGFRAPDLCHPAVMEMSKAVAGMVGAVAAEREGCARVVEDKLLRYGTACDGVVVRGAVDAIRARKS